MTTNDGSKTFDAVEMKRKIQAEMLEETEGLADDELIDYYERRAEEGRLGAWWKR